MAIPGTSLSFLGWPAVDPGPTTIVSIGPMMPTTSIELLSRLENPGSDSGATRAHGDCRPECDVTSMPRTRPFDDDLTEQIVTWSAARPMQSTRCVDSRQACVDTIAATVDDTMLRKPVRALVAVPRGLEIRGGPPRHDRPGIGRPHSGRRQRAHVEWIGPVEWRAAGRRDDRTGHRIGPQVPPLFGPAAVADPIRDRQDSRRERRPLGADWSHRLVDRGSSPGIGPAIVRRGDPTRPWRYSRFALQPRDSARRECRGGRECREWHARDP